MLSRIVKNYSTRTVVVPRLYLEMCHNDLSSAALLNQIVYWSERSIDNDGWFVKSYQEWYDELGLSEYQVRKMVNGVNDPDSFSLKDLGVETEVRRSRYHGGAATLHYRIRSDILELRIHEFLDAVHGEEINSSPLDEDAVFNQLQVLLSSPGSEVFKERVLEFFKDDILRLSKSNLLNTNVFNDTTIFDNQDAGNIENTTLADETQTTDKNAMDVSETEVEAVEHTTSETAPLRKHLGSRLEEIKARNNYKPNDTPVIIPAEDIPNGGARRRKPKTPGQEAWNNWSVAVYRMFGVEEFFTGVNYKDQALGRYTNAAGELYKQAKHFIELYPSVTIEPDVLNELNRWLVDDKKFTNISPQGLVNYFPEFLMTFKKPGQGVATSGGKTVVRVDEDEIRRKFNEQLEKRRGQRKTDATS
jgi:hypothetical protein